MVSLDKYKIVIGTGQFHYFGEDRYDKIILEKCTTFLIEHEHATYSPSKRFSGVNKDSIVH